MVRFIAFFALFGLLPFSATAEFYRCRDVAGTLVVTDDPARFPAGCVVEARAAPKGWASFVETSDSALSGYVKAGLEDVVARAEQKKLQLREYREIAKALVEDYQRLRYQRLHSDYVRDRRQLAVAIREIKAERDRFLEDLSGARISSFQREEIEAILAPIETSSLS